MHKNEEIIVRQIGFDENDHVQYQVIKLVNRTAPRIGDTLNEAAVQNFISVYKQGEWSIDIKVTILPPETREKS